MSEVNADGVLLDPEEALLQQVQHLSNSLMAEKPRHLMDYESWTETVYAANGVQAGMVGGMPHMPLNQKARHEAKGHCAIGNEEK